MQTEFIYNRIIVWNKSIKIFLNRVVGPAVFIWLTYSIYLQIIRQPDLKQSLHYIGEALYGEQSWKFWMVMSLMVVNWLLEAGKWQVLMSSLQPISVWNAFKATLAGVAFAVNTPNRIGEYGGRMLYVEKGKRLQSVPLTIAGSVSQLIVTMVMGVAGLLILENPLVMAEEYVSDFWMGALQVMVVIITVASIVFYFRPGWLLKCLKKIKLPEKILTHLRVLEDLNVRILLRVLGLSFARYLVFVYQYVLILQLMHVDTLTGVAFWLITVLYLILAVIPTVALLELGVRGKAGILLFQAFSSNTVGIYTASTGIWLVNLIVPALAGSMLVAGLKIFNTKQ
ncbi:MAG: flippase-like domain-containing protein [Chitinophagaceae bacterium]|nr:flippase-like domain-containing protein [Chitinophagaceae bacterium]